MAQTARVTGPVAFRQGDGANLTIRLGPVEVQATASDVTLSWADGETRGSAAMPLSDFRRYVAQGLIDYEAVDR